MNNKSFWKKFRMVLNLPKFKAIRNFSFQTIFLDLDQLDYIFLLVIKVCWQKSPKAGFVLIETPRLVLPYGIMDRHRSDSRKLIRIF